MQLSHLLAAGLLSEVVFARPAHVRRDVDCLFATSAESGDTCESLSSSWGISVDDLKSLNPRINCAQLDTNAEYCVIGTVTDDPPPSAPSSSSSSSTPVPTTNNPPKTTTQQVSSTVPTTSTKPSAVITTTTSTTTAGNGVATPQPTQPNMVSNCAKFHWIAQGVSCSQITSYNKISLANFYAWNPSVNADCSGMWAEVYVCVGVIGGAPTTTTTPSTTTTKPATTTTAGNGVTTPTPIQPSMVSNCAKFHWVAQGVTCSQIISYNKITLANFYAWNPSVKADCSGMWAEVYVCVGTIGGNSSPTTTTKPTTTVKPTTTTTTGNGIATPTPIQPGMISSCKKFHYASEGDTCSQIISYNKITLANFVKWNTGVGATCNNMWGKTYVCVGI
ncbi:hypothetical protein NX059_001255 [Plenodomus lindquistii]|nr:hypothetical protein NX059_001255 [Plenodomus lindquistii]